MLVISSTDPLHFIVCLVPQSLSALVGVSTSLYYLSGLSSPAHLNGVLVYGV